MSLLTEEFREMIEGDWIPSKIGNKINKLGMYTSNPKNEYKKFVERMSPIETVRETYGANGKSEWYITQQLKSNTKKSDLIALERNEPLITKMIEKADTIAVRFNELILSFKDKLLAQTEVTETDKEFVQTLMKLYKKELETFKEGLETEILERRIA